MSVVVAGGGLAGAAAACLLARAGREVRVVERGAVASDKICGEFISEEAQYYLRQLGVDLACLGAQPIDRLRLIRGASVVDVALPFRGFGLSRRTLDQALLDQAASSGAKILRGHAIIGVRMGDQFTLEMTGMDPITARTLFLATGKHDLRGVRRRVANPPEELVGFKAYFRLAPRQRHALSGCVEVMLWPDGYGGLQSVEDGRVNFCLLVQRSWLHAEGGTWDDLLRALCRQDPHLAQRLDGAVALTPRPLSIFRVPYGFVHVPAYADPPHLFRLGDQMAVIPSFTGDGMSIALHSAALASACYLSGVSADAYQRRIRRDVEGQIRRATSLYRAGRSFLGQALLMRIAATWPGALRLATTSTRVSPGALIPEAGRADSSEGRPLLRPAPRKGRRPLTPSY